MIVTKFYEQTFQQQRNIFLKKKQKKEKKREHCVQKYNSWKIGGKTRHKMGEIGLSSLT